GADPVLDPAPAVVAQLAGGADAGAEAAGAAGARLGAGRVGNDVPLEALDQLPHRGELAGVDAVDGDLAVGPHRGGVLAGERRRRGHDAVLEGEVGDELDALDGLGAVERTLAVAGVHQRAAAAPDGLPGEPRRRAPHAAAAVGGGHALEGIQVGVPVP